ncbi:MAG: ABC transporter ATP-binding protein [Myxococcales bacterium]
MSAPAILRQSVTRRFGTFTAVDAVSLDVPAGAVFGLIGPNGAGKTTTFSMLCGFLRASAGTVEVLGQPPSRIVALKGRVGVLPQDALLPPNDRLDRVLGFYARLQGMEAARAKEEAARVLASVGLDEAARKRCGELSHGMVKRAALAQAFLGDPELVLLDEPTAGLDPKNAHQIRELIVQLRGRRTVVISSHNLHELEAMCDAAAIMDRGRLLASGAMRELTRATGEIRVVLASAPPPLDEVRALQHVTHASWDEGRQTLAVAFETGATSAEDVITTVLRYLLDRGARISAVHKGHSLEERVLELVR